MSRFAQDLVELLGRELRALSETNFAEVHYGDPGTAWWLMALVLLAAGVTLARVGLRRQKHARSHSGHVISRKHQKPIVVKILYSIPKVAIVAALALLLVAAADPFLASAEEYAGAVESRVRVDLIDVSGSMGWEFPGTRKSKAEVARDAHLKFLAMRAGKNDRVALWLFSTNPYMAGDFVADDELYYFQVWDAPFVMSQTVDRAMIVPREKVRIITAEGDSNIVRPLQAIIRHLEADSASSAGGDGAHRAVLVISDAAVSELPQNELAELHRRNIAPYIIYINATDPTFPRFVPPEAPPLLDQIRSYGGDYFDVTDPAGLLKAYKAIDAREAVRFEVRHRAVKVPIYPRFLTAGLVILLAGIPLGLAAEIFGGTDP
jgi:hypothetical protein